MFFFAEHWKMYSFQYLKMFKCYVQMFFANHSWFSFRRLLLTGRRMQIANVSANWSSEMNLRGIFGWKHGLIKYINNKAKCRHLKKNWPAEGLCGRCLSIWDPEPHTLLTLTQCIRIYSTLIRTGKGEGGELNQRVGERGNTLEYKSQRWVENTYMTECTQEIGYIRSINSDKHLPQSLFTGQILDDDI